MGINSKINLKVVKILSLNRVQQNQTFYDIINNDPNLVYIATSYGLIKLDLTQDYKLYLNHLQDSYLFNSIQYVTSTDLIYFLHQNDKKLIVFSKKYSNFIKKLDLSAVIKNTIIKLSTLFLELKVKETQKRLKIEDQAKIILIDKNCQLIIYDLCLQQIIFEIDLLQKVSQDIQKQVSISKIYASEIDLNYSLRLIIQLSNLQTLDVQINILKFIDRDYRLIKKRNQELQNIFYQLL